MMTLIAVLVWSVVCVVAGVYVGANNPKLASRLPGIKNRAV
jgi:hypothetical protein